VFAPLALSDPERVARLALWATIGATVGGFIAYAIGAHAFEGFGRPLLALLGVRPTTLAASEALFHRRGWMLVALSAVSPLSAKLTCIAAGAFGVPMPQFALAITLGRAARFTVLSLVLRYAGEHLRTWLARRAERGRA
jgi:membrane protein YqaA with SNARE-associated domain